VGQWESDDHESDPREQETGEPPAPDSGLPAHDEGECVEHPDEHCDGHRSVQSVDVEPAEADDDAR
jgi:hypothetical protein